MPFFLPHIQLVHVPFPSLPSHSPSPSSLPSDSLRRGQNAPQTLSPPVAPPRPPAQPDPINILFPASRPKKIVPPGSPTHRHWRGVQKAPCLMLSYTLRALSSRLGVDAVIGTRDETISMPFGSRYVGETRCCTCRYGNPIPLGSSLRDCISPFIGKGVCRFRDRKMSKWLGSSETTQGVLLKMPARACQPDCEGF